MPWVILSTTLQIHTLQHNSKTFTGNRFVFTFFLQQNTTDYKICNVLVISWNSAPLFVCGRATCDLHIALTNPADRICSSFYGQFSSAIKHETNLPFQPFNSARTDPFILKTYISVEYHFKKKISFPSQFFYFSDILYIASACFQKCSIFNHFMCLEKQAQDNSSLYVALTQLEAGAQYFLWQMIAVLGTFFYPAE